MVTTTRSLPALPLWMRTVEVLAVAKVVTALVSVLTGASAVSGVPAASYLAHVILFAATGVALRVMGGDDGRAHVLGLYLLVVSTAWSDRLLGDLASSGMGIAPVASILRRTQVVAFSSYLFWRFVRDFPRRRTLERSKVLEIAMPASLVVGVFLLLANLAPLLWPSGPVSVAADWFSRDRLDRLFWPLLLGCALPSYWYSIRQARHAKPDEQRRVRIMLFGIVVGFLPEVAVTLAAAAMPSLATYARTEGGAALLTIVVGVPEMFTPVIVAYAVLVHHALNLRYIVRRVLRYVLARTSLLVLTAAPAVALLVILFRNRTDPLTQVLSGSSGLLLLAAIATGIAAVIARPHLLNSLDRRFFREHYDARAVLGALVERTRGLDDPAAIARLVPTEIDRALHVDGASVFLVDQDTQQLHSLGGELRPLPSGSRLMQRLNTNEHGAIETDFTNAQSTLHELPESEQQWLADADARLLVAIRDHKGGAIGAIGLGEKRSGLPYSREDTLLLRTIADTVGLAVERHQAMVSLLADNSRVDAPAYECSQCGLVCPAAAGRCSRCSEPLVPSRLPQLLAGKFRPLKVVGRGGMGIVYRAIDVTLGRDVAVKTLPKMSASHAARMRREARAMAAVSHPHLASIYSAETWRGTPALVVEFLHGGTLADRISREGAVSAELALAIGSSLASALACLHDAGILHRDIKPSNIGFTSDGTAKLLDFGLARMLDAGEVDAEASDRTAPDTARELRMNLTATGEVVGTLPYLSPEGLSSGPPTVAGDLWAMSMVLFEAIAGQHPFATDARERVFYRIAVVDIPDIRELAPHASASVASFLRECLSAEPAGRPQTAREWRTRSLQLLG